MDLNRKPRRRGATTRPDTPPLILAGLAVLLLSGCLGSGGAEPDARAVIDAPPVRAAVRTGAEAARAAQEPATPPAAAMATDDPLESVWLVTEATTRMMVVSGIVNDIVQAHADLVIARDPEPRNVVWCAESEAGFDVDTNRIRYWRISAGYPLPAGDALRLTLSRCERDGLLLSGTIDITAIELTGDPATGDWSLEAKVWHSPLQVHNPNGTITSLTDYYTHSARANGGVLETDLQVPADPEAGIIGGLNGQYHADSDPNPGSRGTVNFQLRPFHIRTRDDPFSGTHTLSVLDHPEGPSRLGHYRNGDANERWAVVRTDPPIAWTSGHPGTDEAAPSSGTLWLDPSCPGCAGIRAVIDGDRIVLMQETDGATVADTTDWATVRSRPPPP